MFLYIHVYRDDLSVGWRGEGGEEEKGLMAGMRLAMIALTDRAVSVL